MGKGRRAARRTRSNRPRPDPGRRFHARHSRQPRWHGRLGAGFELAFRGESPAQKLDCAVTAYGPSTSTTWHLPADAVVFVRWGSNPGQPYVGTGPASWAHTTARLQSEAERSLADEAAGPLAQILTVPEGQDVDSDDGSDPLAKLRAGIAAARGKSLLLETTASGFGEGRPNAPQRDWKPARLGPAPGDGMVRLADSAFKRMVAACGASPALFDDSDGTSKRESLRQFHLCTVLPHARLIERELSEKLEVPIRLRFDFHSSDLAGRAQVFQKLVAGGVAVTEALVTTGLLSSDG